MIKKPDCSRYGFLAVFASTDGGITRVFPNMWVRSMDKAEKEAVIDLLGLCLHTQMWLAEWSVLCLCCAALQRPGRRILNPSTPITTDAAWTTKATSSELLSDPVSDWANMSWFVILVNHCTYTDHSQSAGVDSFSVFIFFYYCWSCCFCFLLLQRWTTLWVQKTAPLGSWSVQPLRSI